ncbi:MAG: hypothetical protein V5A60_14000 [Haloarculaceae archaeon]
MTADTDDGPVEALAARTPGLWGLAVAFYGLGDLLTTVVGLVSGRAVEAAPVASVLVAQYGPAVVLPLKLASFLLFYLVWRAVPEPHSVGVPLGLALLGVLLTGWNTLVLLGLAPAV